MNSKFLWGIFSTDYTNNILQPLTFVKAWYRHLTTNTLKTFRTAVLKLFHCKDPSTGTDYRPLISILEFLLQKVYETYSQNSHTFYHVVTCKWIVKINDSPFCSLRTARFSQPVGLWGKNSLLNTVDVACQNV